MSVDNATRKRVSRRDRAMQRKYPIEALVLEDVVRLLDECRAMKPGRTWEILAARLRAAIVIMYRTGLRVSELLDLTEHDLDPGNGTVFVRNGKGGVSRHVGMDGWGWQEVDAWLEIRRGIAPGYLLPVVMGCTAGARWDPTDLRREMRAAGARAGLRKRAHPHALRHGLAVEARREGEDLLTIQAQLGHSVVGQFESGCDD